MPIFLQTTSLLAAILTLLCAVLPAKVAAANECTFSLTCPSGDGPFSTAVLLPDQTSGKDMGPELAQALAEKDIAVAVCRKQASKDETITDALLVVAALKANRKIDQSHIFVLGYGKSGALIPLMARADEKLCGFALLAAAARPEKDSDYNPAQAVKAVERPLIVLQGARDTDVTMDDFQLWWDGMDGRANTTFKVYTGLDHHFSKSDGIFSAEVVNDLSKWLKAQD